MMAVYAAHLTRTLQGTPSIFQVTAQEALGSTIKPALRKLVEYLAAVYPNKCNWSVRWFDELYLLLDACLQYHYLKHYAASFSESFYGLIRVPLSVSGEFNSGHQRLPDLLEKGSLAFLVLLPYLRDKVEMVIDQWREDNEDGRLGKSRADRVRIAAIHLYSIAHVAASGARLAQAARYAAGRGAAAAPALALLGLALRDAPPPGAGHHHSWTDLAKTILTGRIGSAMVSFPMLGAGLLRVAECGAFAVQLLRWWEHQRPPITHLPAPPPPQKTERDGRWANKCPICLAAWRVPAALPATGYVYCYSCARRELARRGACPATGCPAAARHLVRLYL